MIEEKPFPDGAGRGRGCSLSAWCRSVVGEVASFHEAALVRDLDLERLGNSTPGPVIIEPDATDDHETDHDWAAEVHGKLSTDGEGIHRTGPY